MSLYLDVTEFITSLRRTGIERINGELCRHMPTGLAIPVRFYADRYVTLAPALVDAIGSYFSSGSEDDAVRIRELATKHGRTLQISEGDTLLVPEIFAHTRAEYFRQLSETQRRCCRFIIYDLLPLTHPEYFLPHMPIVMSEYLHVLKREKCGFISEYTRDIFYSRLKRTSVRDGVVLTLGSDSLGAKPERSGTGRPPIFTVVGTVEPRKNHAMILQAFEPLLRKIRGLTLIFVGRIGWMESSLAEHLKALSSDTNSGFRLCLDAADEEIRSYIIQSRATIYISTAEGFGLPPVESLWLGTPVIASRTIPSLKSLCSAGIHYAYPLDTTNLRQAVLKFLDDGYADQMADEAFHLNLPTWQCFTREVLQWCRSEAG